MSYTNGTAALKMPSSYVLMNEEEMTYVDGGGNTMGWSEFLEWIGTNAALAIGMLREAGWKTVTVVGKTISTSSLLYFTGAVSILSSWTNFLMKHSKPGSKAYVADIKCLH